MKTLKKLFSLVLLVLGAAVCANAQTALTQTTLAAAVTSGPSGGASGITGSYQTTISLTSATGVQNAQNGQPITFAYVDQELFGILQPITGSTTIFNVLRAQQGTKASPHASGAMVLIQVITPQFGGFTGSGGFQPVDPPINGNCTAASTLVTPWVNVISSAQWLCSTITNTWVPGFQNGLAEVGGGQMQPTAAVVNAATILPTGPLFHLTGAGAYATITLPVGFSRGCITIIQDAVDTWTAAGNIISASTSTQTVGEMVTFCYDPSTTKFYPSHN